MRKVAAMIVIAVFALLLLPAQGNAILLFTDRAEWEGYVGAFEDVDLAGQTTIFETLDAGTAIILPYDETLSFNYDLSVRQVPDGGWATWSGGNEPRVLFLQLDYDGDSVFDVTGTFGPGSQYPPSFGFEAEPNTFQVFTIDLVLPDGTTLSQDVDGYAGAKFFGWAGGEVVSMTISSADSFAFGRMVKGAHQVPEPGMALMLGCAMAGVWYASRKKVIKK